MEGFWPALAVLGAAGLALYVVRRNLVHPLRAISAAVRELAHDAERPVRVGGGPFLRRLAHDVEDLSRQIAELRQTARDESINLRTILSNMVEGVLIADRTSRIRLANDGLRVMFHLEVSPMNRTLLEVFLNHEVQQAVDAALRDEGPQLREIEHSVKTGAGYTRRFFQVTATGVTPRPGVPPMGAVVVFHDVTRLKELENIRQEFVANVSHELRTPLAIINGYLETLLEGAMNEPEVAAGFLRTMRRHGDRLNRLIEDLLTLSKFESREDAMDLDWVAVGALCARVIEQLHPRIETAQAKVHLSIPHDLPDVWADALRLEQALFNLIDNALKYSGSNPTIEVAAMRDSEDLLLSVGDRGPGIPLKDQAHIFERFYRVHKDRSRDAGGTGLGLSIVKHVAVAHGGSVSVHSEPGAGAEFTLRLPVDGPRAQRNDLGEDNADEERVPEARTREVAA